MENFIKSILGKERPSVPAACMEGLKSNFPGAMNVEWTSRGDRCEAIFHCESIEQIALFDAGGSLLEHRVNLPADELPGRVRETAERKGEIMNRVLRRQGEHEEYEIIIRDTRLSRFLLTISRQGELIGESAL